MGRPHHETSDRDHRGNAHAAARRGSSNPVAATSKSGSTRPRTAMAPPPGMNDRVRPPGPCGVGPLPPPPRPPAPYPVRERTIRDGREQPRERGRDRERSDGHRSARTDGRDEERRMHVARNSPAETGRSATVPSMGDSAAAVSQRTAIPRQLPKEPYAHLKRSSGRERSILHGSETNAAPTSTTPSSQILAARLAALSGGTGAEQSAQSASLDAMPPSTKDLRARFDALADSTHVSPKAVTPALRETRDTPSHPGNLPASPSVSPEPASPSSYSEDAQLVKPSEKSSVRTVVKRRRRIGSQIEGNPLESKGSARTSNSLSGSRGAALHAKASPPLGQVRKHTTKQSAPERVVRHDVDCDVNDSTEQFHMSESPVNKRSSLRRVARARPDEAAVNNIRAGIVLAPAKVHPPASKELQQRILAWWQRVYDLEKIHGPELCARARDGGTRALAKQHADREIQNLRKEFGEQLEATDLTTAAADVSALGVNSLLDELEEATGTRVDSVLSNLEEKVRRALATVREILVAAEEPLNEQIREVNSRLDEKLLRIKEVEMQERADQLANADASNHVLPEGQLLAEIARIAAELGSEGIDLSTVNASKDEHGIYVVNAAHALDLLLRANSRQSRTVRKSSGLVGRFARAAGSRSVAPARTVRRQEVVRKEGERGRPRGAWSRGLSRSRSRRAARPFRRRRRSSSR